MVVFWTWCEVADIVISDDVGRKSHVVKQAVLDVQGVAFFLAELTIAPSSA